MICPPLIGLRSIGHDETAATTLVRHRNTIRSPGREGAGRKSNSPSGRGGVLMKRLTGSGICQALPLVSRTCGRLLWMPCG